MVGIYLKLQCWGLPWHDDVYSWAQGAPCFFFFFPLEIEIEVSGYVLTRKRQMREWVGILVCYFHRYLFSVVSAVSGMGFSKFV